MTNVNDCATPATWRDLYVAALLETDPSRIQERIAEAEVAIVARARELFLVGPENIEDGEVLDDALYALRALQNCLKLGTAAA